MNEQQTPQRHGGVRPVELAELGIDPARVLDFSANLSPIGPPAGVREAIADADLAGYPDPDCSRLVGLISEQLDMPPDRILIGNGSTELIHLVTRVFVHRGQRPIALAPTFGEYENAVSLAGGNLYPWQAQPQRGFRWVLKNKPDVLRRVAPPLVFVCNPNNPTGVYLSRAEVRLLAGALTTGPLLLDEAYAGFLDDEVRWRSDDLIERGRVIVVRSLTKDYALAGLRIGYLLAHPDVVDAVRRLQPPWSVNTVAQVAGEAALRDAGYLPRMRAVVRGGKRILVEGLRSLGILVHEGSVNFILAEVGAATEVRVALLRQGFAVRDCTSFGLPGHVRIAARTPDECDALVTACAELAREGIIGAGSAGAAAR